MAGHMRIPVVAAVLAMLVVSLDGQQPQERPADQDTAGFRFKSGVELINVTATVTDAQGRFVPGLRQEDFLIYDEGEPQTISHFSSERVPVSLGVALDTMRQMESQMMMRHYEGFLK